MSDHAASVVRRAVAGDRTAQGELAREAFPRLVALCQSRVSQRADAEELAQETLLRAIRCLAQLESEQNWNAWLRGIAEHLCLDWHRSRARQRMTEPDAHAHSADPAQLAAASDEQQRIRQRIEELSTELKEVLYLHYYDELTYDEMATWLGVARATVNERLSKARQQLRYRLVSSGGSADD